MSLALDRRSFIAVSGAAAAAASAARAEMTRGALATPKLAIFDAAVEPARAFAASSEKLGLRTLGLGADGDLRAAVLNGFGLAPGEGVIGLTRWADWLTLRAALTETGLRARRELRLDCLDAGTDPRWTASLAELLTSSNGPAPTLLRERLDHPAAGHQGTLFAWVMA